MRLGELMVLNGLISNQDLERALKEQPRSKKKIGEVLRDLGMVTEREVIEVLEFQLGFPIVDLVDAEFEIKAIEIVPETLARKHGIMPIACRSGKIIVAMSDPLNYDALEEIRMASGLRVQPMIALSSDIEQSITRHYGMNQPMVQIEEVEENREVKEEEREVTDQDSPIVKLVNQIIHNAVHQQASDIHIEPQEKQLQVKFRVDGVLRNQMTLSKTLQGVMTSRVKIVANLNIAERRLPQDGRIQMQISSRKIDIRVSTLPAVNGESIVLRILDQSAGIKKMSELGMNEWNLQSFEKMIQRPNGIILISGPTGSGKTSTLYSALNRLNVEDVKIITVEDPVEYRLGGITQVQVNAKIGLTFASGLRSILRQDPNIVMVGEMRDTETSEIAVRASLTGHLVLSTIHTNSAVSTISRLVDMGIDSYLIASSVNCVVAQRLLRRICTSCKELSPAKPEEIRLLEKFKLLDQVVSDQGIKMVHRGKGCSICNKAGYRGRIAVHEVLVVDEGLRRLIVQNRSSDDLEEHLEKSEYKNMMYDGLYKVLLGLTTVEEVLKAVAD